MLDDLDSPHAPRSLPASTDALLLLCEEAISALFEPTSCHRLATLLGEAELQGVPSTVFELLQCAQREFQRRATASSDVDFWNRPEGLDRRLRESRTNLGGSSWVYHGTTFARLKSIKLRGLISTERPVWTADHLQEHCRKGVFFTDSLSHALNFALSAHVHSYGRRTSIQRRPVVIRVATTGLELTLDERGALGECSIASSPVSVAKAQVLIGPLTVIPHWLTFEDAIERTDLPPLPEGYKIA